MRRVLTLVVLLSGMSLAGQAQRSPTDVTQWRGAARDGVITGLNAPRAWPDTLTERWKVEIGTGYATPLVVGDRVYQFSRIGDNETMTALDALLPAGPPSNVVPFRPIA